MYSLVGPTGVDYDLTIFNSAGTQIGSAATSSSTETVTLNNQAAGTYFIRVFGFNGAFSSTCYTIRATATTVTSCRSTLDNTTNNATSGAATIPFNTDVRGQVETGGDVDHYRFVITTGGTITLTLTTLPANYNLRLVNSAGTILNTSQNSGTNNETISRSITPGTYFVRVYGTNNSTFNATSCYTVRVQLGTASRAGDEFVSLEKGNPSLEAYPNPVQNLLNVSLTGVEGITELRLFDVNGRPLQSKIINQPVAQLNLNGLPRGVYMIKAFNKGACIATRKIIKQ